MPHDIGRAALIVGAGTGLGASLARALYRQGLRIALAARRTENLAGVAAETNASVFACDSSRPEDVVRLFENATHEIGDVDVAIYNAAFRTRGPFVDLDPADVERSIAVSAFGGFLMAQQAARRMLPRGRGAILFTGASASVKGFAESAPFAMSKFALRGLAQSLARELSPRGIHVAHVIVDGAIRSAQRPEAADRPDSTLDPDAIAENYVHLLRQPRNAWSWEIELRPWVERF